MNRLTGQLARACREHLLDEKWLLAPSLRVGHQWLTAVTRGGQPIVNCHVKTLTNLALELAGPELATAGLEMVSARNAALLIDRILHRLRQSGAGYLWLLPQSARLVETVYKAIDALRRASLDASRLRPDHFEVDDKGKELAAVLQEYVKQLAKQKWVDRAEVFRLAIDRLRKDTTALAHDVLVLVPEDPEHSGLEQTLLEALPTSRRQNLPVDQPKQVPGAAAKRLTDAGLLRWLPAPAEAPPPSRDGTATIFRAVGEANEVREVLRRCLAAGYPLDEVELLYTEREPYVPLIYETFAHLQPDGQNVDDLPVTFQEGIPSRQFRPGRALVDWLAWVRDGYPQRSLVQMIQEGLLQIPDMDEKEFSFSRLASALRPISIGFGRERYLPKLDEQIAGLRQQISSPGPTLLDEDGEIGPDRLTKPQNRLKAIELLRKLVEKLLAVSPAANASPKQILQAARQFLGQMARHATKMDNYAQKRLLDEIKDMADCLREENEPISLNVWDSLAALPGEAAVGGSGPRGGYLHVAPVLTGGHSSRPNTFIVGLDDGRFPGAGWQDPVLLDHERQQLSPDLPTAAGQLQEKLKKFSLLLARLRGTVTLSYSCHDLADDREMFPSPVLLAAFRILSGNHAGDQADMLRWLPPAASFAPDKPEKSLAETEWWLWRLGGPEPVANPQAVVTEMFPHLERGFAAARQRASDAFTIYDGWIPEPGTKLDPTSHDGPVVSASRLETLGRCPLAYFFQYVLEIKPPEELEIDPERWLDPPTFGALLHKLFERFYQELLGRGQLPNYERDEPRLLGILEELVTEYQQMIPPPNEGAYRRRHSQLQQAAKIFLREEEEYWRNTRGQPLFLEASIGLRSDVPSARLDTPEPVPVPLPDGKHLRVRGRIDRVDRVDRLGDLAAHTFAVWDYKTGSSWKYQKQPPFWQGRVIQHALYLELVKARLKALEGTYPDAKLERFGFFFPSEKAHGERLEYTPQQLAEGHNILQVMARIAAQGAFLATANVDDCKYCDYRRICGNVEAVAAASQRKLDNRANTVLQPYLELRPHART